MSPKAEYRERTYRERIHSEKLVSCRVAVRETDLFISADTDLSQTARISVLRHRRFLETYIAMHPEFLTALTPLCEDDLAPPIVREMLHAARLANVGPLAAVAGAIAEFVGRDLLSCSDNVIVENGGDIFMKTDGALLVGIFAGPSPLSDKVNLLIEPQETPLGICTSSATVGPSLSFGRADAVCIKSRSAVLADAAATAVGNRVKRKGDIETALRYGMGIPGVLGIVIIMGDRLGAIGSMEFAK